MHRCEQLLGRVARTSLRAVYGNGTGVGSGVYCLEVMEGMPRYSGYSGVVNRSYHSRLLYGLSVQAQEESYI